MAGQTVHAFKEIKAIASATVSKIAAGTIFLNYIHSIKMKYIIILLLSLLYYSCSQKAKQPDVAISQIQYVNDRILKEQVLRGDTSAYMRLYFQYYQTDKGTDFLPWAIIMANKYHYKRAYQDAFNCILSINTYYGTWDSTSSKKSNLLDTATMNLAKSLLYKTSDSVQINQSLKYIDLLPND